jgi:hypothetical protein
MTNAEARLRPQRRKADAAPPARRMPQRLGERDNAMTQIDCLVEVAKKLKEARILGESCADRALLYFIDMTIVHVCDSLTAHSESQGAAEAHLSLAHVAA